MVAGVYVCHSLIKEADCNHSHLCRTVKGFHTLHDWGLRDTESDLGEPVCLADSLEEDVETRTARLLARCSYVRVEVEECHPRLQRLVAWRL